MPGLISLENVRRQVEADVDDVALQLVIDAACDEVERKLGSATTQTEIPTLTGGDILHLGRRATEITTVAELISEDDVDDLSSNDYELLADGWRLRRLANGDNSASRWQYETTVVYVPIDTSKERKQLIVALVKLDLGYTGHLVKTIGAVRAMKVEGYNEARAALFRSLSTSGRSLIS